MIELRQDALVFRSPEVHRNARFSIDFQRTLRIPDDGRTYPLPAGLGRFALRHVDDVGSRVPTAWNARGGVMLPMYQAEAMWLNFSGNYPWAVKIAAGLINAVTGDEWNTSLHCGQSLSHTAGRRRRSGSRGRADAAGQDYVTVPEQPWLDGFNVGSGTIRQFVAMPLGSGHTAEEQLTGKAEHGGLQVLAYPMKAQAYEKWCERRRRTEETSYCLMDESAAGEASMCMEAAPDMGLGLGGLMRQEILADPFGSDAWDLAHPSRCFVHLTNSEQWARITGEAPPTPPPSAADYAQAGIPWFDYYATGEAVPGSATLADLKSVSTVSAEQGSAPIDDGSIPIDRVTVVRPRAEQVAERW
ncbi:MAG: hypothetical protein RLZ55_671 [Actinomycetota bacterium]